MSIPISGSEPGTPRPARPDEPSVEQTGEAAASERAKQPAFGPLGHRAGGPAPLRGQSGPAQGIDADGFALKPRVPAGSFMAGNPLVLSPDGYVSVVGQATQRGTMLTEDERELSVHEAIAMSPSTDTINRFYLAVDGAADGGAASLGQRWATITGGPVVVQRPVVSRGDHGRLIVKGTGPVRRFLPIPLATTPARLAIDNGELVECLETGSRPAAPLAHMREQLGSGEEGAVFRLGENLAAKLYFHDVDALGLIERGRRVLDRRAQEGFRVDKKLIEPQVLPSGLVVEYKELAIGNHQDMLTRGQPLGERTIAELHIMRELLETHRPFHSDPEFNDPEIMFDCDALPYLSDPVQDIEPHLIPPPDLLHRQTLGIITALLELADRRQ